MVRFYKACAKAALAAFQPKPLSCDRPATLSAGSKPITFLPDMEMMEAGQDSLLRGNLSLKGRCWVRRSYDERLAVQISQQHDLPEVVGRLLAARGVDPESVDGFLNPSLRRNLPDPSVLLDMDAAVKFGRPGAHRTIA